MSGKYFVVLCSDDGTSITELDIETLRERITPDPGNENMNYYGKNGFLETVPEFDSGYFYPNELVDKLLIIKGEIVVPKPKKVVETYDL